MLNLNTLYQNIVEWGKGKGLINPDDKPRQVLKLMEEMGELSSSVNKDDLEGVKDALGDIFVVWTMLVNKYELNAIEVISDVFNEISQRKGIMLNGVFVKTTDFDKLDYGIVLEIVQGKHSQDPEVINVAVKYVNDQINKLDSIDSQVKASNELNEVAENTMANIRPGFTEQQQLALVNCRADSLSNPVAYINDLSKSNDRIKQLDELVKTPIEKLIDLHLQYPLQRDISRIIGLRTYYSDYLIEHCKTNTTNNYWNFILYAINNNRANGLIDDSHVTSLF